LSNTFFLIKELLCFELAAPLGHERYPLPVSSHHFAGINLITLTSWRSPNTFHLLPFNMGMIFRFAEPQQGLFCGRHALCVASKPDIVISTKLPNTVFTTTVDVLKFLVQLSRAHSRSASRNAAERGVSDIGPCGGRRLTVLSTLPQHHLNKPQTDRRHVGQCVLGQRFWISLGQRHLAQHPLAHSQVGLGRAAAAAARLTAVTTVVRPAATATARFAATVVARHAAAIRYNNRRAVLRYADFRCAAVCLRATTAAPLAATAAANVSWVNFRRAQRRLLKYSWLKYMWSN